MRGKPDVSAGFGTHHTADAASTDPANTVPPVRPAAVGTQGH